MEGGYINPSPSSLHCPAGTRGRGPTIAVSKPFVSLPSVLPSFMSGIWLSLFLSGSNYSNPFFPRTEPNSGFSSRRRFSRPPPPWSARTKYTSRVRRRDDAGKVSDDEQSARYFILIWMGRQKRGPGVNRESRWPQIKSGSSNTVYFVQRSTFSHQNSAASANARSLALVSSKLALN